jgi:uncharacterized protein YecE (DUF72 family)
MTDEFVLTVRYKGELKDLNARLLLQGYTHRFRVIIDQTEAFFEPDEEGHYRVVKMPGQDEQQLLKLDRELLQAIQEEIETILAD